MKQKGFTLIELLVVIAIIGILSSVVLASMNSARKKSRDARRMQDIKSFRVALELYFDGTATGSYPTSGAAASGSVTMSNTIISTTYMASIPVDPVGTYAYKYAAQGASPTSYCMGAVLEQATGNSATAAGSSCGDATVASSDAKAVYDALTYAGNRYMLKP
jgi:type II secretion system protein G